MVYLVVFVKYSKIKNLLHTLIIITNLFIVNCVIATPTISFNNITKETESFIYNENKYLEIYNRVMHNFNKWLFSLFDSKDKISNNISNIIPNPVKIITSNFMSNLINEPITIAASILNGDQINTLNSTTRFIINSTLGFGGLFDVANYFGYSSDYKDLGLAMCKYGVPAGPHIIVPLVGPRTLRDGTADVVLVNVLYLTLLASMFGTSFNANVIIGIILMETIGDLVLVRQIDSPEINQMNESYEIVRNRYLYSRELKCQNNK